MSTLTDKQVKALNDFSRTHPHLARVFGYLASDSNEGLGDALNDGGDGASGVSFYGIIVSDGTVTFKDDTLKFNGEQFYLSQDSAGNPVINIITSSGQTPYFIPSNEVFIVEDNKQVLHHRSIITDGQIIINGDLIEV